MELATRPATSARTDATLYCDTNEASAFATAASLISQSLDWAILRITLYAKALRIA